MLGDGELAQELGLRLGLGLGLGLDSERERRRHLSGGGERQVAFVRIQSTVTQFRRSACQTSCGLPAWRRVLK